jgi:hypothetical protein
MDFVGNWSCEVFVSSLNVTFDLKGRIVNLGSALRNLSIAAFGIFGIPDNFETVLDDREALGEGVALSLVRVLDALAFRIERGPSLGNIEEKKPRVGSNGAN